MARLKFTRGSDRFESGDVVFECGGHSQEVSDEVAEYLLSLSDYDFEEISDEDRATEDEADAAAEYQAAEVEAGTAEIVAAEEKAAQRRAAFYGSESVDEQSEVLGEDAIEADLPADDLVPEESQPDVDQHSSSTAPSESTGGSSPEEADNDESSLWDSDEGPESDLSA